MGLGCKHSFPPLSVHLHGAGILPCPGLGLRHFPCLANGSDMSRSLKCACALELAVCLALLPLP